MERLIQGGTPLVFLPWNETRPSHHNAVKGKGRREATGGRTFPGPQRKRGWRAKASEGGIQGGKE